MRVLDRLLKIARKKARDIDAVLLWPELWHRTGGDLKRFLEAAQTHAAGDDAWRYSEEWANTEHDPAQWAARKQGLLTYFDRQGTLRDLDGSRSIFDDVDE